MTVPTLIAKYQKEQTATRLKKAYSTLSQAINKSIIDNGPIVSWDFGNNTSKETVETFLVQKIFPYIILQKKCSIGRECFLISDLSYFTAFAMLDGTRVSVYKSSNEHFIFYVDINGDKKPNERGKDVFEFTLSQNESDGKHFYPSKHTLTRNNLREYCASKSGSRSTCAALIMKDGWRISDDYPW